MQHIKTQLRDKLWLTGIVFIVISLFFFCLPFFTNMSADDSSGMFIPNFIIAAVYFLILWICGRLKKGEEGLHPLFLFFILFFISAWSLNRAMTVFENSTQWFAALQVLLCVNYIAFAFFDAFPAWLKYVLCFVLGVAMVTFIYLTFFLLPLYVISAIAFLALGISLHTFVPLLFSIYTIVLMNKISTENKKYWWSFFSGTASVLIVVISFIVQWSNVVGNINKAYRKATVADNEGLPEWIAVAQKAGKDVITEKVLKAGLVYTVPNASGWDNFLWSMPSRNFAEARKHDPLVLIAALFTGKTNLSDEQRISILESMYDSRHQAQERLWSGENVFTEHVSTAARIWPQLSLAYTELIITVTNAAVRQQWNNQEEAIYTFHLPEGSVVTSLSLWIEGKEEKGILTTKEKASTAYRTIVGYERRDPSVVHWQEGNTVSVRVFPVINGESRMFKVGITSPIRKINDKLIYENVYFDGPDTKSATEDIEIAFDQQPKDFILPAVFTSKDKRSFKSSGAYHPDWSIQFSTENITTKSFSFDGKIYSVRPYQKQRSSIDINTVYLDINRSWTKDEFENVFNLVQHKNVFVYQNDLVQLTKNNKDKLFAELSNNQFSLFPFFKITDTSNSLVISKSSATSPNMGDLKDSRFMQSLRQYLSKDNKLRLFNLGHGLSPYLKTLKEYRVFQYEYGNIDLLKELLVKNEFARHIENDNQVIIDNAELAIVQTDGAVRSEAPDHLMRLFAYNQVMQKMGTRLLTGDSLNTDLVDVAKKAYVVTPVSSLVVLETKKDYERFDITDSQNSLKNASMKSQGAVPEPHEWALIIIAVLVVLYLKFPYALKRKANL